MPLFRLLPTGRLDVGAITFTLTFAFGLSVLAGCGGTSAKIGSGGSEFDASSVGSSSLPDAGLFHGFGTLDASTGPGISLIGPSFDAGGPSVSVGDGGGIVCPSGLQCDVACADGGTTSLSGTVYDPAGKNPIYNVAVYVPASPLQPLPPGVPTGSDACSCSALFQSGALSSATTGVDGTFTLTDVPVGASVPLVIQVGKWRRLFNVPVTACQPNPLADHSIALPGTVAAPGDSMPDIAVSTGSADSLECLMRRIGLPPTEYVAGGATTGHVHIFSGGMPAAAGRGGGGAAAGVGRGENPTLPGAPASSTSLWATQAQLMPYDIVLLSCEGGETFDANPPALEAYLNAGGRAFASHFQYSWFSGPIASTQTYVAPADWGPNLATWTVDNGTANGPLAGVIDTTLNGTTLPFPKGVALSQWLGTVGALGQNGVPAADLSIYQPRDNASVGPTQTASQPWISSAPHTMYFSFDTPVNAPPSPDGGPPNYCGRAVFSDLHVAGDPSTNDTAPPPGGCADTDLSPQEKALEFMLFDLSSCVIPDTVTPPSGVPIQPPPR